MLDEDEVDDERDSDELEKAKLFKDLAKDIFPPDSWEDWEVRALCRMGLATWFDLDDPCD